MKLPANLPDLPHLSTPVVLGVLGTLAALVVLVVLWRSGLRRVLIATVVIIAVQWAALTQTTDWRWWIGVLGVPALLAAFTAVGTTDSGPYGRRGRRR